MKPLNTRPSFAATLAVISIPCCFSPIFRHDNNIGARGHDDVRRGDAPLWFALIVAAGWLLAQFVMKNREWLSQAIGPSNTLSTEPRRLEGYGNHEA
jgi:hypothetical protein